MPQSDPTPFGQYQLIEKIAQGGMAEIFRGKALDAEGMRIDHRSDIFSLGIILFELLTAQRLFKGKNNVETIRKMKKSKVPTPSGIRSSIPKVLDKIVLVCLPGAGIRHVDTR